MLFSRHYSGPWMRRLKLAALFALLPLAAALGWGRPPDAQRVLADYARLQGLYPRSEGSAAERGVLQFIEERLGELGLPSRRFDFRQSDVSHSFSTCLSVRIPGGREDTLLLAVPLNHPPASGRDRDGSINVALALGLLEALRGSRPPLTVEVLFLGAEYGEGAEYPMGSRLFLSGFTPDYRAMTLYLNLRSIPSRLHVRAGGRGIESPFWLIERSTRALRAADLFFLLRGNETQVFRIGLTAGPTIIEPFLEAGYPAVSLEGEYAGLPEGGEPGWTASFYVFLERFLASFQEGIPETWDRHYLFFQVRSVYFRISEQLYVALLLAVFGGILAYSLVFTGRLRRYLRLLGRDFWILPLYFLFIFLLLYLASWALEAVQRLRGITNLWSFLPLPFLAFKLAVPLLIFFLLLSLLRRLHVTRRGSFYSAAALLFLVLDIVVLAVINLSLTYYFLWAFLFALLFSAVTNRLLKLLFFLASPYWLVKTVLELFSLPVLPFCQFVLLSRLWGNLLLAVVLLPFILMFNRLRLVIPLFRISPRRTRQTLSAVLYGTILVGLFGYFLAYAPYGSGRPQPVEATYRLDLGRGEQVLELASPAPLGRLTLQEPAGPAELSTRSRRLSRPLSGAGELLESSVTELGFLDRKNVNLVFRPWGAPVRLRLVVSSPEEFVLYDANFPYQREPDGRRYTLLIGAYPPLPLEVQLTLPQSRHFALDLELEYDEPPPGFGLRGADKAIQARLLYHTRLELET